MSALPPALTDAAPLSAPAFSLVFPMLKMVLTEMPYHSEEEEELMAQILQILTVHAQLRASPDAPPDRPDEVGRELSYLWLEGCGRQGFTYFLILSPHVLSIAEDHIVWQQSLI